MTDITQAAARCADLANAVDDSCFVAADFSEPASAGICLALRREVEAKDAMIREVLVLLETLNAGVTLHKVMTLLRANLLPDPAPTLLEEFEKEVGVGDQQAYRDGARDFADWIAKRQENEG